MVVYFLLLKELVMKTIQLVCDKEVIVDDKYYDFLIQFNWRIYNKGKYFSVQRSAGKYSKTILLASIH